MTGKNTGFFLVTGIVLGLLLLATPVAATTITEFLNTNLPGSDYQTVAAPRKGRLCDDLPDGRQLSGSNMGAPRQ